MTRGSILVLARGTRAAHSEDLAPDLAPMMEGLAL